MTARKPCWMCGTESSAAIFANSICCGDTCQKRMAEIVFVPQNLIDVLVSQGHDFAEGLQEWNDRILESKLYSIMFEDVLEDKPDREVWRIVELLRSMGWTGPHEKKASTP